jgi:hypothetical protein
MAKTAPLGTRGHILDPLFWMGSSLEFPIPLVCISLRFHFVSWVSPEINILRANAGSNLPSLLRFFSFSFSLYRLSLWTVDIAFRTSVRP